MTNRSFPLTLQGFLLFLTSHLTAYPHRFLKIRTQNQAKHGDWQAQKSPETKKDRFPKENVPFFLFPGMANSVKLFFHVCD